MTMHLGILTNGAFPIWIGTGETIVFVTIPIDVEIDDIEATVVEVGETDSIVVEIGGFDDIIVIIGDDSVVEVTVEKTDIDVEVNCG